jgi:3-hydroxyacyl-CoA dehydrogenase/enoyl-CoA hydratase/3-hydroxybutyryl-CoA epimerase
VPGVLQKLLDEGCQGRKAGRGFYVYRGKREEVNPGIDRFRAGHEAVAFKRGELRQRMVLLMVNEAARCLEEGVVAEPSDADFGMIMGTGFAPFQGGPLRYADATGLRVIVEQLERWAQKQPAQFAPCQLLRRMVRTGKKFYTE